MHMDSKRAQQLLDLYWAGESSLEEEKWLRAFFRRDGSEALDPAAAVLFRALEGEVFSECLPEDFGRNLPFKLPGQLPSPSSERGWFHTGLWWRIAAGFSLLALAAILLSRPFINVQTSSNDTFDDPREAFDAARNALLLLSEKLNEGERYTQKIILLNEAENRIKTN